MYCKIGTCHYNDILYLLLYIVYHIAVIILKFYKELEKSFSEIEKIFDEISMCNFINSNYSDLCLYHFGLGTFIRNNILQ